MSNRAIMRATGIHKVTVARLMNDAGRAFADYQDAALRGLNTKRVQVDEIWSFTYTKQQNVPTANAAPEGAGDTWTWTAIDADSKLVMSWMVGGRDGEYAIAFTDDVAKRLVNRVHLTSDSDQSYLETVEGAFGGDLDCAMWIKLYGATLGPAGHYSPANFTGIRNTAIEGKPDTKHVSTFYVESQNLTMRMHTRRIMRLTNGSSKKVENHANAVALHFAYYNFVRIHKTLRVTPAMVAGVTDRPWEMSDLVAIVEAAEAPAAKVRGTDKKKPA
jgi:IS1 family transposase